VGECRSTSLPQVSALPPSYLNFLKNSYSQALASLSKPQEVSVTRPEIRFPEFDVGDVPNFAAPETIKMAKNEMLSSGLGGGGGPAGGGSPQGGRPGGGGGGASPQGGGGSASPNASHQLSPDDLTKGSLRRPASGLGQTALGDTSPGFGSTDQGGGTSRPLGDASSITPGNTTPVKEPTKFNLAFLRKNGEALLENLCGGTPVGKSPIGEACTFAIFTAAHCVEGEFTRMQMAKQGETNHHIIPRNSLKVETAGSNNDAALLYFEAACDFIADNEIAKFAEPAADSKTPLRNKEAVFTRNQEGQLIEGRITNAVVHENSQNVVADEVSGPHSRPGDSGSPIWNRSGHLVGALSGGSAGRLDFSFSDRGNHWALSRLAAFQMLRPEVEPPTGGGIAQLAGMGGNHPSKAGPGPGIFSEAQQRPVTVANRNPLHQAFGAGPFQDQLFGKLPAELHGVGQKCVACHNRSDVSGLVPAGTLSLDSIGTHMAAMNETSLNDMMKRAGLSSHEQEAVKQYVQKARETVLTSTSRGIESRVPACYMSEEEQTKKTNAVPVLQNDSLLGATLADAQTNGRMIFFDRSGVPRTWSTSKVPGQGEQKLYSEKYHTNPEMYRLMGYHSDGAREHPWAHSAGMDVSPNGSSDKFIIPPASGPMMRTVSRSRRTHPDYFGFSGNVNGPENGYEYSTGTMVGEVMKVSGVPFEIRLRMKTGPNQWQMDVLRPFENMQDLVKGLETLCSGSSAPVGCRQKDQILASLTQATPQNISRRSYLNKTSLGTTRDPLTLNSTALEATQAFASLQSLPDMPTDVVRALLTTTPFKSVFGKPWTGGPPPGWAPTTQSDFNIVPKNYFAGLVPMTQNACMKCHDAAGKHVDMFDPKVEQMNARAPIDAAGTPEHPRTRTWYNHIPGDDGILSFHPYSKAAVTGKSAVNSSALNDCLVKNGLIQ